jgi:hypothetical protein
MLTSALPVFIFNDSYGQPGKINVGIAHAIIQFQRIGLGICEIHFPEFFLLRFFRTENTG